ncbi:MAG: hypothetical protein EXS05_16240 [Planctomycetaceae bacterium]|nr:hypothetical protein [Planctomycetaceae bacterium]
MAARKLSMLSGKGLGLVLRVPAVGVLLTAMLGLSACATGQETESPLAVQIRQAERILIVTPEKDVDAPGGEQFLVEINRVVRGSGKKGQLVRITNSGDDDNHPRYKAGRQYVVLLNKNPGGKGWVTLANAEIPIADGQVGYLVAGETKQRVTLEEFDDLVARNEFSIEAVPRRETPAGKWFLVMSRQGSDFYIWLLDITQDKGGAYRAKLLESSRTMAASTLKEFSITDQDVGLTFLGDNDEYVFRGRLDQGKVFGETVVGGRMLMPTRLLATESSSLKQVAQPQTTGGREDFIAAISSDDSLEGFQKFVKRHSESPLALDAYADLIAHVKERGYDRKNFETLAKDYQAASAKWGPLFELKSQIDLGLSLSRTDFLPELALEYLTSAEQNFRDDAPGYWKTLIRSERGKRLLLGDKPEEGLALLNQIRSDSPFDADITWLLAKHADQQKEVDTAIDLYSEVVSLPLMERSIVESQSQGESKLPRDQYPSRALGRLWKQKHGDTKGLSAHLNEVYEQKLHAAAEARLPPRKAGEGTRVVLCELFTGSDCPPCVAADVATSLLETTYAQSEVIVLRYHQHIPGPDPLANDDTQERFEMYSGEGTPTLFVDGRMFPGATGSMAEAPMIYKTLRTIIDPILNERTNLKLELTADANQGKLTVSAKAAGLETFPKQVRLRLAVAEDKIAFVAGNGVRFHEMIVRTMPAGVPGVKPDKGQLTFRGNIDLAKLKTKLLKGLAGVERETQSEFEQKPLDLKALHLVAFLQNDETGEILQAAAIAVSGSTAIAAQPAKPAAEKTPRSKAPAGGKN